MVKLGLIGTGILEDLYYDYFQRSNGITWAGHWTGEDNETLDEFILRADAFVILDTPSPLETVLQAFRSGKHVLLDSVNTLPLDEIDRILSSRKEAGVHFHTGLVDLFHPAIMSLKAQEIAPRFIEAYHSIDRQQPVAHDLVLHEMLSDIAIITHLVQSDVKRVAANGLKGTSNGMDLVNARLEFANGCVAVLTVNHLQQGHKNQFTFYEETRIASLDLVNGESSLWPTLPETTSEPLKINSLHNINDAHINRLNDFTQSILEKTKPMLKLRDIYKQVEIAHKILKKVNSLQEE